MMRPRLATWLAIGLIAALFFGGIATGIAIERIWLDGDQPQAARVELPRRLQRFARRLDLSADQRAKVRAILEDSNTRIDRLTVEAQDKILELLTPEQAVRYEAMVERRKKRRQRRRDRRR